jgi:predicted DNA-binding protein with PD1-like motif
MTPLPIRLRPGDDLRRALEATVRAHGSAAAFVVAGIGSLSTTRLRLAGADDPATVAGDIEILTLSGTIAEAGSHLHMAVADAQGRVSGGHVAYGCVVRTTAEVLIASLPGWHFGREIDATTGYAELAIRRVPSP